MNRRSTLHTPFNGSTTGLSGISISCSLTCFLFVCLFLPVYITYSPRTMCPRGLTFTWWGCCGLCFLHKPSELAHFVYFVLMSVSVFMALSTVLYSINSPDNSQFSYSVLPILFLTFSALSAIYLFMKVSLSPDVIPCVY